MFEASGPMAKLVSSAVSHNALIAASVLQVISQNSVSGTRASLQTESLQ